MSAPASVMRQVQALEAGQATALGLLQQQLQRIDRNNAQINALVCQPDRAALLQLARQSDRRRSENRPLSRLDGVSLAVKDNIDVAGLPTTAGLGVPVAAAARDATAVSLVRRAGMLPVGKLNMHEAALGATTDNPHLGRCHNPRRRGFTPGGSSGGSGAWVAAGMGPAALGTDTMGSVRIPAAYCGVSGLKPTCGWLSDRGVVAVCPELDTIGPLAAHPADLAVLLSALANRPCPDIRPVAAADIALGWLENPPGLEAEVGRCMQAAKERLQACGYRLQPVSLQGLEPHRVRRAGLALSELAMLRLHCRALKEHPHGFSAELRAMLDWAQQQPPQTGERARQALLKAQQQAGSLLHGLDALLLPTAPQTAFAFDAPVPENQADYTALFSVSGHPALSMPIRAEGLPVGLQLVGQHHADFELLALAAGIFARLNATTED